MTGSSSRGGGPSRDGGGEPRRRRGDRGGGGRGAEQSVVPDATFTSYYGRPVVKAAPWNWEIPAYLFTGGLAAGSSLLAAGADLTGRTRLRRASRLAALVGLGASGFTLVHDLGRPSRFLNMLRVAKLTSPMSVGTWILSGYGPFAGLAAAGEVAAMLPTDAAAVRLMAAAARPAGLVAAVGAPPLAAYTAVLLADTATPSWHEAYRELPLVFCGSAAAASGGLAMLTTPVDEAGPARRLAVGGAVVELLAEHRMERSMGITAEPLHEGTAGRLMTASKVLTGLGAAGTLLARRNRTAAAVGGAALVLGSLCTRFGVFTAGMASARDPRYTVVPQRERLQRGDPARSES